MRLQKLLYYVQAWHLAVTDEPLFDDQIKAWRQGPVVPQVWHTRQDEETRRPSVQDTEHVHLDDLASDLIDLVLMNYGSLSGEELSVLTHAERPWLDARGDLPEDAHSQEPVSTDAMARYYRAHRKLAGRAAADLAAGGVRVPAPSGAEPVDVDAILDSIPTDHEEPPADRWGGANLDAGDRYDTAGIADTPGRTYTDW